MSTLLKIFIQAIGWYAVLTIPSLLLPIMYLMSIVIALAVCWIAGLFFIIAAKFLKALPGNYRYKTISLAASTLIGVLIAFRFIGVFKLCDDVWEEKSFLLFPVAAVLASWICIYRNKLELAAFFTVEPNGGEALTAEMQSMDIHQNSSPSENIPS